MLNRKRIFAIVLFILIGLFVYTFANPAEELEPLDNDTNVEDVDKNTDDETDDEDVIQLPDQNININPQVVAVNYGVLRTAVDNGNVIVNLETEDEDLNNLLEQLETATNSGQQLITNQINDQNLVNNGANTINQLLTQINALLTGNLNEAIEAGNDLLDEYPEESNLNLNLIGLLEDLSDAIEEAGALKNPTAQQMLDAATEILDIIIEIEEFQADLDIINDMSLELVPSTTDWTNQDITLTAEIDIEDLDLIDDITIVRGDTCGLEENPTFSGLFEDLVMQAINTEEVTISENDDYTACVTFTNGELRSATYTVENIDKQAPIVSLTGGNINVEINTDFVEPGVTVTDNSGEIISPTLKIYYSATGADGTWVDAPNNIIDTTKLGSYNVWYKAKDSAGNLAIPLRRTVTVRDTIKPIVQLIGGDMVVEVNTPFTNPGVTITDNSNETLSPILTVYYSATGANSTWTAAPNNMVDTTKLGKYAIWIGAKDSSGNTAESKRRYVTVNDTIAPRITGFSVNWNYETVEVDKSKTYEDTAEVYTSDNSNGIVAVQRLGCNVEMGIPGDYKCQYKTTDESGNVAYNDRFIKVVDTTAPTISINNYGAQYDEGPIQLEIVGNDQNGVGLHTEAYSFNNEPWSSVKTATFSQNGPVNIKVRDANGNERSTIYTITNIVQDYLNFDTINTTDASGDDYWMTDRFAPMAFVSEMFGGDNRIKLSINQANAQIYGGFYGTQGRKILTGDATEISIDLYIPDSAATSGRRFAGFWGTAFNASNAVTGWPIIEFTSYNSPTDTTPNPRFRVWDSSGLGAWYDTGLPAGFQYNQWHRLTIKWQASTNEYIYLVDGIVISKINDTSGTVRLGEAMLQGYNVILPELTPNTMSYDIYWDNFVSKK